MELQETMDQLAKFEQSLEKMTSGDISLIDSIGSVQLAIQAAIKSSTSPDILNMFLKKENGALRTKLANLDSDRILGRITADAYTSQATEIVKMLEKLGEPLSGKELELLRKVCTCQVISYEYGAYFRNTVICYSGQGSTGRIYEGFQ